MKKILLSILLLAAMAVGWQLSLHFRPTKVVTRVKPYIAPRAPIALNLEEVVVPANIVALKPTSREIEAIEEQIGSPLSGGTLLDIVKIDALPNGGFIELSLQPLDDSVVGATVIDEQGAQRVVARVFPKLPSPGIKLSASERDVTIVAGAYLGKDGTAPFGLAANLRQSLFTQTTRSGGALNYGIGASAILFPDQAVVVGLSVRF